MQFILLILYYTINNISNNDNRLRIIQDGLLNRVHNNSSNHHHL